MAAVLASPFVLFAVLCILLYLPPIQNYLVDVAARYASNATGMQISIHRISLKFPLDLVVHQTTVVDKQDTILSAERLTVKVQLLPLFEKKVELDGLRLENARLNTGGLMEGMTLKGNLGELFIMSHGVELNAETAVVNKLSLKDTRLSLVMADTTASDTASSPLFWKIRLDEVDLQRVSFRMDLPLDTLGLAMRVTEASLRKGNVDLHQGSYSAERFSVSDGTVAVDLNREKSAEAGLDPMHIRISQLNARIDSIRYAGKDIYARIERFDLKERSGLDILSTKGRLAANDKGLHIPLLKLATAESDIDLEANMDWDATDINKEGTMRARLMANIGKHDLMKLVGGVPQELTKSYPPSQLAIKAGIDGNLKHLRLTSFTISMPGAFRAEAKGEIAYPMDSLKRNGGVELQAKTGDMSFLNPIMGGVALPSGLALNAKATVAGSRVEANADMQCPANGKVTLEGMYDTNREAYTASLNIDGLNLHDFMPKDSLFLVTAEAAVEGEGLDFFSPRARLQAGGGVSLLEYGSRRYGGVDFKAELKQSQVLADLAVNHALIQAQVRLNATLHPKHVKADLVGDLKKLNLQAMGVTEKQLFPSLHLEAQAETNLKDHHGAKLAVTDIRLKAEKQSFKTKDLHAGIELAPDSLRSFVNAGDLTFLFRSDTNLDKLTRDADRFMTEMSKEWEKKSINQKLLKELLPSARLRVFSGSDNPLANMLAISHVKYDRLKADIRTSPHAGLNGNIDLYGLRTDSLKLDTIYFRAEQDSAQLNFRSGVKALANKWQEAFTASLDGYFGSTEAQMNLEYLNGRGEKGVDLGLKARLHPRGISFQVSPETPTLVYRPFTANEGNYVYVNEKGKIYADMKLYDTNHTGISLYSTPDSLAMQDLTLGIHHLDIGEIKRIVPYMPDVTGSIDAEAHYVQNTAEDMQVAIDLATKDLVYNKQPMGNWGMNAVYLPGDAGEHCIDGFFTLNDEEVVSWGGSYLPAKGEGLPDELRAHMRL